MAATGLAPQGTPTPAPAPAKAPTSWAPTAKVSIGVLAASLVTLLMPMLKHWLANAGVSDTTSAGAALTTIVTFIVQYWVPERK